MTLQRFREWLALGLIVLLPFHAFMVTVLTKWIAGPGHAPLGALAIWKEGVLGLILLIAIFEIASQLLSFSASQRKIDLLDALIIGLIFLGVVVSFLHSPFSVLRSPFVFGFRYDFIPLIAFVILRRVSWSDVFLARAMKGILSAGVIIAVYGIISFFLPATFFTWLGYSDLHSLYLPDGPLAPFQQIGGTVLRRIQSVMSGPNQLGLWLLLPIAVVASSFEFRASRKNEFITRSSQLLVLVAALVLTFSRAAWIGAAVIIGVAMWPSIHALSRRALFILVSSFFIFLFLVVLLFPSVFVRISSTRGHFDHPLEAIGMMMNHPLGLGLGTAGPATNRTRDVCILLRPQDDASWAKVHPNLCVFLGDTQVQPVNRVCSCPFLPENWYLQIGVEMGWLGLGLYLTLVMMVLRWPWKLRKKNPTSAAASAATSEKRTIDGNSFILHSSFFIFVGLSVAALFLHAWEDSAVAYTVWVLIATVFIL